MAGGPAQVELDSASQKLLEWREAERDLARAKARIDKIKTEFREAMRALGANTGTVNGRPVLTRRHTKTFRGKDFAEARPDLVEQYTKSELVEVLDLKALAAEQPRIYESFLAETLRPDWKSLEVAISTQDSQAHEFSPNGTMSLDPKE
ncbi:MAG TPA: hypothetical protein VFF53_03445 [Geobacteraceae bacterium]|nr:hypothetical protein [Geobacteraceae bacterium]